MKNTAGTTTKKPVPVLKKTLKIEFKEFTKAAAKGVLHLTTGNFDSLGEDGADMLGAVGLSSTPSEVAWLLVYRAIVRAMRELVNESFGTEEVDYFFSDLLNEVNSVLEGQALTINRKFFECPESEKLLVALKLPLVNWLKERNIEKNAAESISHRLPAYFAMSLHNEWAASSQEYTLLKESVDTPFTRASERLQRWALYETMLLKQVEEPMFNESFSLKRVFVTPRAFYIKKDRLDVDVRQRRNAVTEVLRVVVDLKQNLDAWLDSGDSDDAIRLISGGPGSGKSSFAKMYAATLARRLDVNVLFIPLHHFEPSADLIDAVGKFVQAEGILAENPLIPQYRDKQLVLVFDGLDELAMQGKIAERTAQDFIREVQRKVILFNQQKNWIKVIVSGRELVVQQSESDFRREGQILHLLPYFVDEAEAYRYADPLDLLSIDQRSIWWRNYGEATGMPYHGLPEELDQEHLNEITSQPLLNYLVALSLKRGQLNFSAETNLNAVYADLLKAIYERGWSKQQHLAIQGVEETDFGRILEEIALAAWHGDGRKTTVREITAHCDNSNLQVLLARFQTGLEQSSTAKVTQLLTAFYFRQSGQDAVGDKTFEFTHKSFGEYLTARRIVREMVLIRDQLRARKVNHDIGWNERDCLRRWSTLVGSAVIDQYLLKFILGELRLIGAEAPDLIRQYQDIFCELFGVVLKEGIPSPINPSNENFKALYNKSRNAEEALFVCLNACAQITRHMSSIDWEGTHSFSAWFARAGAHDFELRPSVLGDALSHLNLSGCNLTSQFFYQCDLSNSNLDRAKLVGVDIRYSKVAGASMNRINLAYANVIGTIFDNALLEGADFEGARLLRPSKLTPRLRTDANRTSFVEAHLAKSKFTACDLRYIDFTRADLRGASFRHAILIGADFTDANLEGADFRSALISDAVFKNCCLEGAIFEGSIDDDDELEEDEDE